MSKVYVLLKQWYDWEDNACNEVNIVSIYKDKKQGIKEYKKAVKQELAWWKDEGDKITKEELDNNYYITSDRGSVAIELREVEVE